MLDAFISGIKETVKNSFTFISSSSVRTGTKISTLWLFFIATLLTWILVGMTILSIFYPHLVAIYPFLSNISLALLGSATIAFTASETRKTFENIKGVSRQSTDNFTNES